MENIIGAVMIFSLFAGFFIYICIEDGWLAALKVYTFTIGVSSFIALAIYLMGVK